jgi:two-component system cell cycle response regulator
MAERVVLVVEDNPLNMKLIRSLLQMGKYRVLEARDAETGLALAQQSRPDLILMDIQLPGMDGLEATRILKEDPGLREIPVLALTAHAMAGDEQKALEAGCGGYITKPVDTRNFLKNLEPFTREREEMPEIEENPGESSENREPLVSR